MSLLFTLIDLTHTLTPAIPSWNGCCGFNHEIKLDHEQCTTGIKFRVQQIKMHAGVGTHIDAPSHCISNGKNISDLEISELCAPCIVIDISAKAHETYSLNIQDIQNFETKHGKIPPNHFVIVYTGWDRFWTIPEKYHNGHIFPSISKEATLFLLERKIVGVGIDTLSPDRPEDGFFAHQLILGAGKYIIENIANAKSLPSVGAYTIALPLKIANGTEAPLRLIGLVLRPDTKK